MALAQFFLWGVVEFNKLPLNFLITQVSCMQNAWTCTSTHDYTDDQVVSRFLSLGVKARRAWRLLTFSFAASVNRTEYKFPEVVSTSRILKLPRRT